MDAELLVSEELRIADGVIAELIVWLVPLPLRGSNHRYKYRFALVAEGVCVLRYDNETGKGDHRHIGADEHAYHFVGIKPLRRDFLADVRRWLDENRRD
jgi:hypothetical protein